MKKNILIISFILLLSCSGIGKERLTSNFYLTKIDYADSELSLSFRLQETGDFIGVVPPKVIGVGFDKNFIIAKQQQRDKINFYIIPLKDKIHHSPDENKIGPLSKKEFILQRKIFGVPDSLFFRTLN